MAKWLLDLWEGFLDVIYAMLQGILMVLPNSPIQSAEIDLNDSPFANVMSYINYFVPVGPMLAILTVYLTAVGIWYISRWILRVGKYIQ